MVGGGLAGLAAAGALKDGGWFVELFERSRLLGGRATSFEIDGIEVDNGQHVFLGCCDAFIDFVDHVGMRDRLFLQERFDVVVYSRGTAGRLRAAPLPAPFHLLGSFLGYSMLGWRAKVQVGRALAAVRRERGSLKAGETFAQWLARNGQGEEAIRAFWEPFMVPALNVPLDRMSAAEAAFVISTAFLTSAEAGSFGYAKVTLVRIMDAAAERLDAVHVSSPVFSVEPGGDGARLRLGDGERSFDAIVCAVGPKQLQRLLPEPLTASMQLERYDARAIVDVHVWHDCGALDFDFVAVLDSPVQWVFQKAPGYLACSLSAADDVLRRTTAELIELCWSELRANVTPLRAATLQRSAVTRSPEATYAPPAGVARPAQRTPFATLALAGAWTETGWPDTMESAVRSGIAASEVLCERTNAASAAPEGRDERHVFAS